MTFLFGDLTPAPFTISFLEQVRETIEFAAALADADQCVVTANARRAELRRRADEEKRRVDALVADLNAAADRADKGDADSVTSGLAAHLAKLIAEGRDAAVAAVDRRLGDDIRATETETLEARADYLPMLQRYLLVRVPPASTESRRVEVAGSKKDERHYLAEVVGRSEVGLEWSIELLVPGEDAWSKPMRVDHFADGLAITAPQRSGLLKKEVKPKGTKVDRHFVTKVVDGDGAPLRVELRDEIGAPDGFDLSVDLARKAITIVKTGDAEDASVGGFDLAEEDQEPLLSFAEKLRADVRAFTKSRLVTATFDGLPFDGENTEVQPKLVALVSRLADTLAPPVGEIAGRSRSAEELVLRRLLDDGRREELFLPRARLRKLLEGLDLQHRELFAAFETALERGQVAEAPARVEAPAPPVRSEVPRATGAYVRRDSNKRLAAVQVPAPAGTAPATLEIVPDTQESRPPSSPKRGIVAELSEIEAAAAAGKVVDAFRGYAALFGSPSFHTHPVEEQRRALSRLIHGNTASSPSDELSAAYRAAIPALQALVVAHREPGDYAMLGMSYVALAEPAAAKEMFKKALELERARDPESDLCGSLTRRVSEL